MAKSREEKLSMDVASPDEVPNALRGVADRYRSDAEELDAAHGTHRAGSPWRTIARQLDLTAARIEKALDLKKA